MGEGFKPELVTVTHLTSYTVNEGTGNHTGPTVSSGGGGGGAGSRPLEIHLHNDVDGERSK